MELKDSTNWRSYFRISDFYAFLILSTLTIVFSVGTDALLIQKTYLYFGEGALNRPYALTHIGEYFSYFIFATCYDLIIFGCLLYFFVRLLNKFSRLNSWQIYYSVFSFFFILYLSYTAVSMGVVAYFSGNFDFSVLKELAGGDLSNIFAFISLKQWLALSLIFVIPAINLVLVRYSKKLSYLNQKIQSVVNMPASLPIALLTLLLVAHAIGTSSLSLQYGLSNKLSYVLINSLLESLSDFDRDGFGPFSSPRDPDNFNAAIKPYALEVLDNNIDEDGLGGDLNASHLNVVRTTDFNDGRWANPRKNILVIVIETFRSDVIGKKLDSQEIMPHLSALAQQHAITSCYSNYGITARAIQTIFKGSLSYTLSSQTLFDKLKSHGYRTLGVSAQAESWGKTDKHLRFSEFDFFYDARNKDWHNTDNLDFNKMKGTLATIDSVELNQTIFKTLEDNKAEPFIMYINYQDLHYPYFKDEWEKKFIQHGDIRAEFFSNQNRELIFRQYANAANHLDQSIHALVQKLKLLDLFDNTVILLTGDHPDSFYENGVLGHAWTLDKYQRDTPLVVINGSGEYIAPVGQDEIAEIALNSVSAAQSSIPATFTLNPEKQIFVLSGPLPEPRKIGFLSADGLDEFDFKTRILNNHGSQSIISDSGENNKILGPLVRRWESEFFSRVANTTGGLEASKLQDE